jgi:tetratricopeptide (TPR) repeat protein
MWRGAKEPVYSNDSVLQGSGKAMQKSKKNTEAELREAIATFEQILEAIPNDRLALETLADAYEQLGHADKALEYYIKLAHVVAEEGDRAAAPLIRDKLREMGADSGDAHLAADELDRILSVSEEPPPPPPKETGRRKVVDITAELALAWNLVQGGELTQEEYAGVVHDLTESSAHQNEVPVTVLHVLRDRGFKNYDRVMAFLAGNTGLPIVPIGNFELQKEAATLLPKEIVFHRGAVAFEIMANEPLIAILNPYDTELRKEIEKTLQRRCHFYLTTADDYDKYLEALRKTLAPPPEQS